MPRVLVTTDGPSPQVLVDEQVNPEHLDSDHSASQLIERLAWGIEDAAKAEAKFRATVAPRRYTEVAAG